MEWTVVTVLVAIVGLFFTVGKPIVNLNTSITKLQVTLDNMGRELEEQKKALAEQERSAHNSHSRIWAHEEEQDRTLNDHERRLGILEHTSNHKTA